MHLSFYNNTKLQPIGAHLLTFTSKNTGRNWVLLRMSNRVVPRGEVVDLRERRLIKSLAAEGPTAHKRVINIILLPPHPGA